MLFYDFSKLVIGAIINNIDAIWNALHDIHTIPDAI